MNTGCNRRVRGLTLIELMVVLGLSAVLVALTAPSFGQMLARQRLKAAAENLALDLAELRFAAAQRGSTLHLNVAPGTDWCYALAVAEGCDCHVPQGCQLKTVRAKDHPGVLLVRGRSVLLDANSTPGSAGTLQAALLQSADGQQLSVAMTPLGRPKVCAPSAVVPGYAPC